MLMINLLLFIIFIITYYLIIFSYIYKQNEIDITILLRNRTRNNLSVYVSCSGGLGNRLMSFYGIFLISIIRKRKPKSIIYIY